MGSRKSRVFDLVTTLCMISVLTLWSAHARAESPTCDKEATKEARKDASTAKRKKDEKKYKEAAEAYEAAFNKCRHPIYRFNAAEMYLRIGDEQQAKKLYDEYLDLLEREKQEAITRQESNLLLGIAKALRGKGDQQGAFAVYKDYLERVPKSSKSQWHAGILDVADAMRSDEQDIARVALEAYALYIEKVSKTPADKARDKIVAWARTLHASNPDLALEAYKRYLELARQRPELLAKGYAGIRALAETLHGSNPDLALQAYERYREFPPKNQKQAKEHLAAGLAKIFELAEALRTNNKLAPALRVYERYLELAPDGADATRAREGIFAVAETLYENKDNEPKTALEAYERYLKGAPATEANRGIASERVTELREILEREPVIAEPGPTSGPSPTGGPDNGDSGGPTKIEPVPRSRGWIPLTVAGSALVIVGVGLEWDMRRDGDAYDQRLAELCPLGCQQDNLPEELDEKLSSARRQRKWAIASWSIGGAAVAVGLIWYAVQPRGKRSPKKPATRSAGSPESTMDFTPLVSPQVIGGSWQLRF